MLLSSLGSSGTDCELNTAATGCRKKPLADGPLYRANGLIDPYVAPKSLYLFWGSSSAKGTLASALEGREIFEIDLSSRAITLIPLQGDEDEQVRHSVSDRYFGSERLPAITMKMMKLVLAI